jgi:N6-adenosine-specific RNA methylase IME4
MTAGKYGIIYADPPWGYTDKAEAGERGAGFKYPVMPTDDIAALNVPDYAADECVLFMWATFPMYADAQRVMAAWGFVPWRSTVRASPPSSPLSKTPPARPAP